MNTIYKKLSTLFMVLTLTMTFAQEKETLMLCLKDWKNAKDSEGAKVPFNVDDIDMIPSGVRTEIYQVIRGTNKPSKKDLEDAEKN